MKKRKKSVVGWISEDYDWRTLKEQYALPALLSIKFRGAVKVKITVEEL